MTRLRAVEAERDELAGVIDAIRQQDAGSSSMQTALSEEIVSLRDKLNPMRSKVAEAERKVAVANQERASLLTQMETQRVNLANVRESALRAESQLASTNREMRSLEKKRERSEGERRRLQAELEFAAEVGAFCSTFPECGPKCSLIVT